MMSNNDYPSALPVGTILAGMYEIGRVLGQGGFGITYAATELNTGKKVAIKEFFLEAGSLRTGHTVIPASKGREQEFEYGLECFINEAKLLATLKNIPNIINIYNCFKENGTAYFAMEYIQGISFKDYLKQNGGKVDHKTALSVLMPVADALEAVHRAGIIHRDVTPDNIYITDSGSIKLLDFGSARFSLGDKTKTLDVVLKHGYAPKEQYARRGKQGPYTDVYSLCACFYTAITGKVPPDAPERLDEDNLLEPSSFGVRIPRELENAILKGLEMQASDRYQNLGDFKAAVAPVLAQTAAVPQTMAFKTEMPQTWPISQVQPTEMPRPAKPIPAKAENKKDKSINTAVAAVLIAAVILTGVIFALGHGKKAENAVQNSIDNAQSANIAVGANLPQSKNVVFDNLQVGDTIKLGRYDDKDIEWLVLDTDGNTALVISKDIIEKKAYNDEWVGITWENCTLRNWLNNDFYNNAFTENEKKLIIATKVINDDNQEYGTAGGNDTADNVFLLSIDEANKYFADDDARSVGVWWWLRSLGYGINYAADVNDCGTVDCSGCRVDFEGGVCPALNLKLSEQQDTFTSKANFTFEDLQNAYASLVNTYNLVMDDVDAGIIILDEEQILAMDDAAEIINDIGELTEDDFTQDDINELVEVIKELDSLLMQF